MNTKLIDKYETEMIKRPSQIREVLKEFCKELQAEQLILNGVSRSIGESAKPILKEMTVSEWQENGDPCRLCIFKDDIGDRKHCRKCDTENNSYQYYG